MKILRGTRLLLSSSLFQLLERMHTYCLDESMGAIISVSRVGVSCTLSACSKHQSGVLPWLINCWRLVDR